MQEDAKQKRTLAPCTSRPEQTQTLPTLLRKRLDDARGAGEEVLKLEPEDLRSMCREVGIKGDPVEAFRALVRSNLVRLRGRWREGGSGRRAPVYVARLTGRAA